MKTHKKARQKEVAFYNNPEHERQLYRNDDRKHYQQLGHQPIFLRKLKHF